MSIFTLMSIIIGVLFFLCKRLFSQERKTLFEIFFLKKALAGYNAILASSHQGFLVWESASAPHVSLLGGLPAGCPQSASGVLAFESWLCDRSALQMHKAVSLLRREGRLFEAIPVYTRKPGHAFTVSAYKREQKTIVHFRLSGEECPSSSEFETLPEPASSEAAYESLERLLGNGAGCFWGEDEEKRVLWANKTYLDLCTAQEISEVIGAPESLFRTAPVPESLSEVGEYREVNGAWGRRFFDIASFVPDTSAARVYHAFEVTPFVKTQLRIHQELHVYKGALNHLTTAIVVFDSQNTLQCYNTAFVSLFDLDKEFLNKRPDSGSVLDILRIARKIPEQINYRSWRQQFIEMGQISQPQKTCWHLPDGRVLDVLAMAESQGGICYIFENVTDYLDLKSRYNSLLQVQTEMLNTLSEAVAVFGSNGRLRLWNTSFVHLWSLDAAEMRDRPHIRTLSDLCCREPADRPAWEALCRAITELVEERRRTTQHMRKGQNHRLDCSTVPLPDGSTLVTFQNVTNSLEEALCDKDRAQHQESWLRNCFVCSLSYELRLPLKKIIEATHTLSLEGSSSLLTDQYKDAVARISTSCSEILTTVNDSVELAVLDLGVKGLALADVRPKSVIDALLQSVSPCLNTLSLSVNVTISEEVSLFRADEKRLSRILYNMLSYMLSHTEQGSALFLTCHSRDNRIYFDIESDQSTLDSENVSRTLQFFTRSLQESISMNDIEIQEGLLSLVIAKSLASLHGGAVDFMFDDQSSHFRLTCWIPEAKAIHAHREPDANRADVPVDAGGVSRSG